MTSAEQAEVIMRKHLGLVPPWDRPWKLRAFERVLLAIPTIAAFRELGTGLLDEKRKVMVEIYTGQKNGHDHEDFGFNVWLLNECIGDRIMSGDSIFLRCLTCQKIRTSAGMGKGPCKCGSNRLSNAVGPMDSRKAMAHLAAGY